MSSATVDRLPSLNSPDSTNRVGRVIALGPVKRLKEFEAENLSRAELSIWAARYPEEVPMVNGELAWIGLRLADLD